MSLRPSAAPQLAVCIPTHHGRRDELRAALSSLAEQLPVDGATVEVCISDNASHDGTEDMVREFARSPGLALHYSRNAEDLGLAANILRSVELANAPWCWLFGSDDTAIEGSLAHILDVIRAHPQAAGISVKKLNVAPDLSVRYVLDEPAFFPTDDAVTAYRGFSTALRQIGLQPCYLSSNVVRRDEWQAARERHLQAALAHPVWPQVVLMIEMLRARPEWVWSPEPCVNARAWTTFVSGRNRAAMMAANLDGQRAVFASLLSSGAPDHRAVMARVRGAWATGSALRGLKESPNVRLRDEARLLAVCMRAFVRVRGLWTDSLPVLLVPNAARRAWRTRRRPAGHSAPLSRTSCKTRVEVELPVRVYRRDMLRLPCRVSNQGDRWLSGLGTYPVGIGYRWLDAASGALVDENYGAMLGPSLEPGRTTHLTCHVHTPWEAGRYVLSIAPVQHDVVRFEEIDPGNGWRAEVEVRRVTAPRPAAPAMPSRPG